MARPTPVFAPKQLIRPDATYYSSLVDDATINVARYALSRLPPLSPNPVIHDNGCGCGEVTQALLSVSSNPPSPIPPNFSIHATDIDSGMLAKCHALKNAYNWPIVDIRKMAAEKLGFENEFFDLSVSNFVIFNTQNDGVEAAREVFRTLKKGGCAIFTTWATVPHARVVDEVNEKLRGEGSRLGWELEGFRYEGKHLEGILREVGFGREDGDEDGDGNGKGEGKVEVTTTEVELKIRDLRHYASMVWSLRGVPEGGWTERDVEVWDEAVGLLVKGIEGLGEARWLEGGRLGIRIRANVAIAVK